MLLLAVCQPVAAEPGTAYEAFVAGRHYAVPGAFAPIPAETTPLGASAWQMFSIQFVWPGPLPVPPHFPREYPSGLVAVSVQDISPATQVEHLAAIPGQRAKFLTLWRDSTVDQFGLATDFDLSSLALSTTDEAARLGLQSLGPLAPADQARGRRLFSDGPPASLSVLMMCEAGVSCQMWWMQDEAAMEATFDERFLPDWSSMRRSAAALLARLQVH